MRLHLAFQVDKAISTAFQRLSDHKVTETTQRKKVAIFFEMQLAYQVDEALSTAIQQLSDPKVTETLHNTEGAICLEVHGIRVI